MSTSPTKATPATELALAQEMNEAFGALQVTPEGDLVQLERLFSSLYSRFAPDIGKSTSRAERQAHGYASTALTYGEVEFGTLSEQLLKLRKYGVMVQHGGKFVDIGSGAGKAVFAAALLHTWTSCLGIEILQGLHHLAEDVLDSYNNEVRPNLCEDKQETEIQFMHGDALAFNWNNADVVFANSTCFDAELMASLADKARSMRDGSVFITTTKPLPSNRFVVVEKSILRESWGEAAIFIHVKGWVPPAKEEGGGGNEGDEKPSAEKPGAQG